MAYQVMHKAKVVMCDETGDMGIMTADGKVHHVGAGGSGGGSTGGVEFITIIGKANDEGGTDYSCNKTKEECVEILANGTPCFAIITKSDSSTYSTVCNTVRVNYFMDDITIVEFITTPENQYPELGACFDSDGNLIEHYYDGE